MSSPVLSELLEFTRDGEWGKGEPEPGLVKMGVIRGTDFERVRKGDLTTIPIRYIPEKAAERKQLQPNDLLIETAGGTKDQPTGRSVFLSQKIFDSFPYPLTCASFSRFLRVRDGAANPAFLFWYLQYLWHERLIYQYHIQHTGVARFQYTLFASEQTLPENISSNEQREIAAVLGALDDKIELNRKTAATLEEMARALYRSWFVDFDPVHAKAAGLSPAHMDEATAALFPDRFGEDGLPEGWKVEEARQHLDIKIGKTPPRKEAEHFTSYTQGQPWLSIRDMGNFGVFSEKTNEGLTKDSVARFNVAIATKGTVLLSFKLTVGRVTIASENICTNEAIAHMGIRNKSSFSNIFLFNALKCFDFDSLASTSSIATAVNSKTIRSMPLLVPDEKLICSYDECVRPFFAKIWEITQESQTLAALRDTLLPKLMSGELRVGDAREQVEEAV